MVQWLSTRGRGHKNRRHRWQVTIAEIKRQSRSQRRNDRRSVITSQKYLFHAGEIKYGKNGFLISTLMHVDKEVKLWAFFDVYGNAQRIKILGSSWSLGLGLGLAFAAIKECFSIEISTLTCLTSPADREWRVLTERRSTRSRRISPVDSLKWLTFN